MTANLCFRDDRGNLLMLGGFTENFLSLFSPRSYRDTIGDVQDNAAIRIMHETGFIAATALLVCIDGGKK